MDIIPTFWNRIAKIGAIKTTSINYYKKTKQGKGKDDHAFWGLVLIIYFICSFFG